MVENSLPYLTLFSTDRTDSYYFIKTPGISLNKILKFKLIVNNKNEAFIKLSEVADSFNKELLMSDARLSLTHYIEESKPVKIKVKLKKTSQPTITKESTTKESTRKRYNNTRKY